MNKAATKIKRHDQPHELLMVPVCKMTHSTNYLTYFYMIKFLLTLLRTFCHGICVTRNLLSNCIIWSGLTIVHSCFKEMP